MGKMCWVRGSSEVLKLLKRESNPRPSAPKAEIIPLDYYPERSVNTHLMLIGKYL